MKLQTGILLGQLMIIISIFIISVSAEQADNASITINAVQPTNIGDLLVLSGNTTLPKDTHLVVSLIPDNDCYDSCIGAGTDAMVFAGQDGQNTWSVAMDTSSFGYGNYQINVTQILNYTPDGLMLGNASTKYTVFMKGHTLIDSPINKSNQNITDGFIILNTIDPKKTGDKFLIRGSTNLPVGTDILWEISPDQTQAWPQNTGEYPYISSNSMVVKGDDQLNQVSDAIDTISFKPGVYNISCAISKGNLSNGEWKMGEIKDHAQFTVE